MKPFVLAVALMGVYFSGLSINAKAGGAAGGVVHKLVEEHQSGGEEIPSSRIASQVSASIGNHR